ncbi:hypothetical protein OYC64_008913 [Pagothenia borchgrevinki]|uniref:Uncharacterized protein n=1 Tax=Pagothenia borchgrevinki TaxID=8213 RepID=A0ABD2G611_PAGBO
MTHTSQSSSLSIRSCVRNLLTVPLHIEQTKDRVEVHSSDCVSSFKSSEGGVGARRRRRCWMIVSREQGGGTVQDFHVSRTRF